MTIELTCLLIVALALPVTTILATGFYARQVGTAALVGNREHLPAHEGLAGRARRAHANLLENALPFAVVVLIAHQLGISNAWTSIGALVFVVARLVHFASYAAGITVVRTLAFYAGLFATFAMAAQLFFGKGL
jgi:uncharacterized MAPEG superfamily protein